MAEHTDYDREQHVKDILDNPGNSLNRMFSRTVLETVFDEDERYIAIRNRSVTRHLMDQNRFLEDTFPNAAGTEIVIDKERALEGVLKGIALGVEDFLLHEPDGYTVEELIEYITGCRFEDLDDYILRHLDSPTAVEIGAKVRNFLESSIVNVDWHTLYIYAGYIHVLEFLDKAGRSLSEDL